MQGNLGLELILIIVFMIENITLAVLTLKRFFEDKSFLPILGRWGRAFTYMSIVGVLNFVYILIRIFVDIPPVIEQGVFIIQFHFIVSMAIRVLEILSVLEFFKIAFLMRNAIKYKRKYMKKSQEFSIDILVTLSIVFTLTFLTGDYNDFFFVGSALLEVNAVGYKGIDIYVNTIISLSFLTQYLVIPKSDNKVFREIKTISIGNTIQKSFQLINIIFFNYTSYVFMLLEWIPSTLGVGYLVYFFGKNYFFNKLKNKKDLE